MSDERSNVGSRRAIPTTVVVLVAAGVSLEVAFAVVHPGELADYRVVSFFYLVPATVAFVVVATAVIRRQPGHPVGRLFGMLALVGAVSVFANGYTVWDLLGDAWVASLDQVAVASAAGLLALALLLFPDGRVPSPRWRWLLRVEQVQVVAAAALGVVAPRTSPVYPNEVPTGDTPLTIDSRALADIADLVAGLGTLLLLLSAVALVLRWRRSTGDRRLQLKWLGLAGLAFAVAATLGPTLVLLGLDEQSGTAVEFLLGDAIWNLALTLVPVAMGLGIVRYRLYDIDRLISRTLVYGILAWTLGAVYVATVVAAGGLVTSGAGSGGVALVATAVVAVVFHPLRVRLTRWMDRRVYGPRAAPYELVAGLARELAPAAEPETALGRIAESARRAVGATTTQVSVVLPDGEVATARRGDPTDRSPDVFVPIVDDGESIGTLAVTGGADRPGDREVLDRIAGLATPAVRNVRLLAELERLYQVILDQNREIAASRSRLIAAATSERRNLQRQVAERIDPLVSVLRQGLAQRRNTVDDRCEAWAGRCRDLAADGTRLVEEIRALSRGVLPPVLADHGLVAALRSSLRRLDLDAILEASQSVEAARFDRDVESTVFLCCRAALDDARASAATRVTLGLELDARQLRFTLDHDAPGGPAAMPSGELSTGRDLIRSLGGELDVRGRGAATVVTGEVPLEDARPELAQPTSLRKVSTA